MAWDFTGGLLGSDEEDSDRKQNSTWDFTGGLTSESTIKEEDIKALASKLFVDSLPASTPEESTSSVDPRMAIVNANLDPYQLSMGDSERQYQQMVADTTPAPQESGYARLDRKVGGLLPLGASMNTEKYPIFLPQKEYNKRLVPEWKPPSTPNTPQEGSWFERAGQTGSEVITMQDRPDRVTTGSKLGDISADVWGNIMGFAVNPVSAGAKLWGGTERLIGNTIPLVPSINKLPEIVKTGFKIGATTPVYESTMAAVNDRPFYVEDAAVSAGANALLGMATHGIGKGASTLGQLKKPPLSEITPPKFAPEVSPLPFIPDQKSPKSYRLPNIAQGAMERLNEGIKGTQDYIRHNDILAAYPPGTTVEKALADIKVKTGVDLPKLMSDVEMAQSRPGLRQQAANEAKYSRLGQAAGVIPVPEKLTRFTGRERIIGEKRLPPILPPVVTKNAITKMGLLPGVPNTQKPLATEAIQAARSKVQNMDDILRVNETPEGPVTLYSGIPAEKVADSVKDATTKLQDALGIPVKGDKVEIVPRLGAKQPGIMTPLKSPSRVAREFPQVKEFVDSGVKATETQERLRNVFNQRLATVDKVLTGGKSRLVDPLRGTYKQNKEALNEILLTGDMMGKKFTPAELRSEFGASNEVIRGYNLIRSAYDHAHTIASNTRELRGKTPVSYREGYIPHFFHSWFITMDGKVVGSAKTMREAVAMSNPIARQKGANIKIVPKAFDFPGGDVQAAVMGDLNYFNLKSKIEKDFGISREDAQSLLEGVARMKGRSRFVGNFMQRKGVAGWEKNLDWVNRHYFNMISRYAALDQFKSKAVTSFERQFGAFDKEHKGVAGYIKNYINDINGNPTQVEDLINNSLAKVPALSKFLGTYLGERPALQIASATTKGVAIAKLGLYNVSSAMVNATQLINSYSKLGERWTFEGLRRATALGAKNTVRGLGLARAPMSDMGILKQLGIDTQMGLESGAGYSKAADVGKLFNKSMAIFQSVENFNRRVTGLGAYYRAIAEGKAPRQAIEYAKGILDATQFNYSIAETPAFIRRSGPVGQILFQFKKFPIKQLEFITQLKGAENPRFWIPFTLLAGYYAMPGIEMLKNSVKSMFDIDIELESKKYLMDWAGDDKTKQAAAKTIMYGIGASAGVDISKRIGTGDFIPGEASDFAGPALSTVIRAAQLAGKKEWVETLRAISPAAGNLALMLSTDQEISDPWNRGRLKAVLSPTEKALKGIGFAPASESVERDVSRVIGYSEQQRKTAEQSAIDGYIKALDTGDNAKINKAVDRLAELKITPDRVKEEMGKKGMLPAERAIENVPKKRQEDYRRIYGFK